NFNFKNKKAPVQRTSAFFLWCAARDSNKLLLRKILLICSALGENLSDATEQQKNAASLILANLSG
ncbi:MAG: hypothetical protein IKU42_02410, partial [Oscillospiraceae bacterium]|nr:hypothetical protein [Oscillospiraceae bacterium]